MTFGVHFLFDAYHCNPEVLADRAALEALLHSLPEKLGMHTITVPVTVEVGPNNKKDPGGVSGFVMIAESHISFHTFPKRGFLTADVYTCHDELDTDSIQNILCEHFGTTDFDTHTIERGVRYPEADTQ